MFEPKPHLEPSYGPREWLGYPEPEPPRSRRPLLVIGAIALGLVGLGLVVGLVLSGRSSDDSRE